MSKPPAPPKPPPKPARSGKASKAKARAAPAANPFSHKAVMGVLAFVLAAGGYGGYQVLKTYGTYGTNFDKRPHLVEQVVDGDTLVIEDGVRVRLLGVDAPETGACFGAESKRGLSEMVLGREITLEKDQTAADHYDRLLRYVFLYEENPESDATFVNERLARNGLALSEYVKPNRRYLSQLQAAEREAEAGKAGLWAKCDPAAGRAAPEREEASDPESDECVIKGNIDKGYEKNYFLPGCPDYQRVKVDLRKGERWFCTEKDAADAGWQKSPSCGNLRQAA